MPRKRGSGKPRNEGGTPPAAMDLPKASLTSGYRNGPIQVFPWQKATGYNGNIITTIPSYEPMFVNRPHVLQIETVTVNPNNFAVPSGTQQTALADNTRLEFSLMTDNLARAYANVQNLLLTQTSDAGTFISDYMRALSIYIMAISILNGDGFNERVASIATFLTPYRSRIMTGYSRLQTVPMVPGIVDAVNRCCGLFAEYEGGPVVLHYAYSGGTGTPTDLSVANAIAPLLTAAETSVTALLTDPEAGQVRTILAEYYGNPPILPFPGVKVGKAGFSQFLLMAMQAAGTTNSFGMPAITAPGSLTWVGGTAPIFIPRGCETDPWWQTLYRVQPYMGFTNTAKATLPATPIGMYTETSPLSTTIRVYQQAGASSSVWTLGGSLNGFANPMNDFYFAAPVAAQDVNPFQDDLRMQRDYVTFYVTFDYIVQQTTSLQAALYSGKQRLPMFPGTTEYNVGTLVGKGSPRT